MRLPIIKNVVDFIDEHDQDYVIEAMEVLEHMIEAKGIKDEELDVIGELLSNLSGALNVHKDIREGKDRKKALNDFMARVLGSIDK